MKDDFEYVLKLAIDKNNLDALVHIIVDNAKLSYSGDGLRITNEETIMQFIKYLYPNTYESKLDELKKEETNKCQE